ncbi:hypothetical protein FGIG_13990, partial [Fasciola gigantica]
NPTTNVRPLSVFDLVRNFEMLHHC